MWFYGLLVGCVRLNQGSFVEGLADTQKAVVPASVEQEFQSVLASDDPSLRAKAIRVAVSVAPEDFLARGLADPDPWVQRATWESLSDAQREAQKEWLQAYAVRVDERVDLGLQTEVSCVLGVAGRGWGSEWCMTGTPVNPPSEPVSASTLFALPAPVGWLQVGAGAADPEWQGSWWIALAPHDKSIQRRLLAEDESFRIETSEQVYKYAQTKSILTSLAKKGDAAGEFAGFLSVCARGASARRWKEAIHSDDRWVRQLSVRAATLPWRGSSCEERQEILEMAVTLDDPTLVEEALWSLAGGPSVVDVTKWQSAEEAGLRGAASAVLWARERTKGR